MKRSSVVLVFCGLVILAILACGGAPTAVHEEPVEEPVYEEPMTEESMQEEPMTEEPMQEEPMTEEPAEQPAQPEPPAEESKSAEFNPSNANQVPPDDVLNEVTYYGGGGRGSTCEGATEPILNILSGLGPHEWMDLILVDSCGWQENEIVTATLIYPDSSQASERVDAGLGFFGYDIQPTRSMQPGTYRIIMEGNSGYVEDSAEVSVPASPRMYRVEGNWLVLYSFSPHENIRLLAYEPVDFFTMRLVGWKGYQTDANGQLMIHAPAQGYLYYAVGEISGLVKNSEFGSPGLGSDILVSNCGGLPSRLYAEAGARVTFTDGSDMRIREKPGYSEDILTAVPEGTAIVIQNSRKCADGSTWWKILTDEGLEGWMAEDQNGVYLLEPYP
jgi:hypothetical protein